MRLIDHIRDIAVQINLRARLQGHLHRQPLVDLWIHCREHRDKALGQLQLDMPQAAAGLLQALNDLLRQTADQLFFARRGDFGAAILIMVTIEKGVQPGWPSGDQSAEKAIALDHQRLGAQSRRGDGRRHTGAAAADDEHIHFFTDGRLPRRFTNRLTCPSRHAISSLPAGYAPPPHPSLVVVAGQPHPDRSYFGVPELFLYKVLLRN